MYLHIKKKHYSWLPITCTLANLNLMLTWTKVDFPHTFIVILPLVPRTLDNSNLPLTQSNSCFPSNNFYIILPSKTWTMFKCVASQWKKKRCTTVGKSEALKLFQNNRDNSLFNIILPIQVSLRAVNKEMYKKCCTVWSPLGVNSSFSHTHGLPEAFSFNFPTSIPVSFLPPRELSGLN